MRFFKVLHDFQGEDAVELSARKGEVVCADDGTVAQDGWLKVEIVEDALRSGFVPLSYLQETSRRHSSSPPQRRSGTNNKVSSPPVGTRRDEDDGAAAAAAQRTPARRSTAGSSHSPSPRLTPARAHVSGGINRNFLSNPNAVVEAFMKNEIYFKQLMRNRADALAQVQLGVDDAIAEVAACKDRNSSLTRKLRELDQVVEKERRRWTERLEEEKEHVSRSLTYAAGGASASSAHHALLLASTSGQSSMATTPVHKRLSPSRASVLVSPDHYL